MDFAMHGQQQHYRGLTTDSWELDQKIFQIYNLELLCPQMQTEIQEKQHTSQSIYPSAPNH